MDNNILHQAEAFNAFIKVLKASSKRWPEIHTENVEMKYGKEKLKWTGVTLVIFFVLGAILYAIGHITIADADSYYTQDILGILWLGLLISLGITQMVMGLVIIFRKRNV